MTGINTPGQALDPRGVAAQGSLAARRGIEPGCRHKNDFEQAQSFFAP